MAQYAQLRAEEEEDTEAAMVEAKAAARAALQQAPLACAVGRGWAQAEALDVASDDAMLNYQRVEGSDRLSSGAQVVEMRRNRES